MKTINIYVKVDNNDIPYEYKGEATINKDLIEFNDKPYNYIFDKKAKRLIKSNQSNLIIIDFLNQELKITEDNKEFTMKIEVKKITIDDNNINAIYNIENNEIKLHIKEV